MLTIFISGCSNEPKEDDLKTSAWALSSVCSAVYRGVQDGSISDSSTYQDGTPVTWAAEKNSNMITKREAAEKVTVQQALDYYKGVSLNTILKTMNIENFDIQSALSSGKYVYVNKGDPYRDSGQHVILYKDEAGLLLAITPRLNINHEFAAHE